LYAAIALPAWTMKDEYKAVGSWGTLGLEIVLSILIGYFGGHWLDERFGTGPWISIVGFFFGCGAAGKAIHRTWKEMAAVTEREEREHGNPAPLYEERKNRADPDSHGDTPFPTSPTGSQDDDRAG
jgi:F0F1-type ATP synthase assembly protein I